MDREVAERMHELIEKAWADRTMFRDEEVVIGH